MLVMLFKGITMFSTPWPQVKVKVKHLFPVICSRNRMKTQIIINNNGHVRYPRPATWVKRTQNAIQALPAPNSPRTVDGDRQDNFSRSHLNQHTSSQSQGLLSSQRHAIPQLGTRSASPQPISGNRHASPISPDHFSSHQRQSLYQRAHLPVRSSGLPGPHVRLGGAPGGVGSMTSLASSQPSQYSLAAIQRATSQIKSPTLPIPPPIQTSVPVAATGDQSVSPVDGSAEENWRPTGRMRGSLSGPQYAKALKHQSIIQRSEPVQAARPPPVLNTPDRSYRFISKP
ncbi:hypothetical protein L1987_17616 [Smallanthus sonchifolius]|uniref:Uncharacterized protein n=1 Tax=Smallanthus sonchifolius TaxID=185202 RepID=A0ACB9IXD7_9ASTR|nr:hypothetical protein L1987_17616 [Smallanthus sonchifolius]